MNGFMKFIHNKYIYIPVLLWFGIQLFKLLYDLVKNKKFNFKRILGAGGMPSSHSAVVTGLATLIGKYEGVDSAIFAISFARIHRSNLINNGILPLVINQKDYDFFNDQDEYELINLLDSVENNKDITVINKTNNQTITAKLKLSPREKTMIQYGGLLNAIKELGGDF